MRRNPLGRARLIGLCPIKTAGKRRERERRRLEYYSPLLLSHLNKVRGDFSLTLESRMFTDDEIRFSELPLPAIGGPMDGKDIPLMGILTPGFPTEYPVGMWTRERWYYELRFDENGHPTHWQYHSPPPSLST